MNPNEESILQIIRVEEPASLDTVARFTPGARRDELDACLWELYRQGRVSTTDQGTTWCLQESTMPRKPASISVGDTTTIKAALGINTAPAEFRELPLSQIVADPQIRRFFDPVKMQELADSIAARGVDTPIIVRPGTDDTFHLIAGERRWRASKIAGKETIPALIRLVDNATALTMQIDENEQRENLHPLEAAEGYKALMTARQWELADLTAHIGKSLSYLRDRLRLLDLPALVQDALWDGTISLSVALEIATVRDPESQEDILRRVRANRDDHFATAAQVRRLIRRDYFRLLAEAKFPTKDKTLVPEAGACPSCLKRSKAQSDLFEAEFTKKDSCLDKGCWEKKQQAFVQVELKKAKEAGRAILPAKTVKEIMPYSDASLGYEGNQRYVALDAKVVEDPKGRTYGQILGDQAKVVVAAKDGEVVHLLERKDVREAIKKAAPELALSRSADPKQAAENKRIEQQKKARKMSLAALFGAIELAEPKSVADAGRIPFALTRLLARVALRNLGSDAQRLLRVTLDVGDPKDRDHEAVLNAYAAEESTDPYTLLAQIVAVDFLDQWTNYGSSYSEELRAELGTALGLDLAQEYTEALKTVQEAEKAKAKSKGAKAK